MPDGDVVDTAGLPMTGPLSGPATAAWSIDDDEDPRDVAVAVAEPPPAVVAAQPRSVAAPPVLVAGQYHFLSWWKLALMLLAVWIPAAGVGLGLFSWWYALADKTPVVFVVLVYTVVMMVAGMIVAMVVDKPLVSAVAIGLMSAVFVSGVAAAPMYGHYYCQHVPRCVAGILPY